MTALFTGKGDNGMTKTYGCDQRISKSSAVAEALGSLDEINSFLGICKILSKKSKMKIGSLSFEKIIHEVQENLFKIQAEAAGFPKHLVDSKNVKDAEAIIFDVEKQIPSVKTFFISGGTELAATLDFARTLARRAERRIVAVKDESKVALGADTLPYMNRLSSLLYALARFANHKSGISEESPDYK